GDEPTRQVDDSILAALRNHDAQQAAQQRGGGDPGGFHDEPTRMAPIDPRAYDETGLEEMTRPADPRAGRVTPTPVPPRPQKPPPKAKTPVAMLDLEDHSLGDEATRMSSIEGITAMERARQQAGNHEDRTRAVNIRNDPSMSEVDWDLD
ncbi:MAG: hypothetical protein KF773_34860, partial [Deltaproteobacteria bacterium]|nr:hypothetical protein [Deltaproteobacteria bacterium]